MKLELIENQEKKSKPAFKNEQEYEYFRSEFAKQIEPDLIEHARRREESIRLSMRHYVY